MRLLVLCPHFDPDVAPTGVVMSAIVEQLARRGHDVHVVTSLPWYREHRVEGVWRGRLVRRSPRNRPAAHGRAAVILTRVHPFPTRRDSIAARAGGFAGLTLLVAGAAITARRRPDAVLAMSPPVTLGLAGWVAARRWRVPLVFNLQDIFPDAAIEVGALRNRRLIAVARRLELFIYRRCAAVTVLSNDMQANIAAKLSNDSRKQPMVRVIPNFTDIARIKPRNRLTAYREEFGLGDRTVVMYAGNVGFSQPLELLLAAARKMADRSDVVFVVNGDGSARPSLEEAASGLHNVVFVDFQPPERLEEVLATSDLQVIVLRKGLAHSSVPSKLYSILAAGRPVVAAVDHYTEIALVLEDADCGVSVPADDEAAFTAAVAALLDDPQRRAEMGRRGRSFVESCMSASDVAAAYETLIDELRSAQA